MYIHTHIGSPLQMDRSYGRPSVENTAKARNSMFFICVLLRAFTALTTSKVEEKNGQHMALIALK